MILRVLLKCKYHRISSTFARCSFSKSSSSPLSEKIESPQLEVSPDQDPSHNLAKNANNVQDRSPHSYQVLSRGIPSQERSQIQSSPNLEKIHTETGSKSDKGIELLWRNREIPSSSDTAVYWLRLSKYRLTGLVVATTLAGFTMGCDSMSANLPLLTATLAGTALTSSSAAALNQFLEIPFDSQMARTRSRPLVVGQITPLHAFIFASITGAAGLSLLAFHVNSLTAILGAANLILYSFIYTPMKRSNILNTWIGSFVGAIPPVMGFTAATGMISKIVIVIVFKNVLKRHYFQMLPVSFWGSFFTRGSSLISTRCHGI